MSTVDAARSAWKTYGSSEETDALASPERRRARFALLASLYAGTAYVGEGVGKRYREANGLYSETRQIVNSAKALCDFYAAHLYAGPTSPDGQITVEGRAAALPLVTLIPGGGTAEQQLRLAFGQLSHGWWAWDTTLVHRTKQTAILGTTLTEIIDEPATGKLMMQLIYPGVVDEVTLDESGNIKGYALEYVVSERGNLDARTGRRDRGRQYRYRKIVDNQFFRHYEDDHLVREDANPYGFVPAVWDRHGMAWGDWGEPAILGSQTASDELNELWSHADDRLHQLFSSPLVVSGAGSFEDKSFGTAGRSKVNVFGVPPGGQVSAVAFSLGEVMVSVEKIMDAIAMECPELRVYERIQNMTQATGPGIRRAVADVEHRVNNAAALYDRQTVKLLQMATAIAGWRIKQGDWGSPLTAQQQVFAPFGLDSFKAGALDAMLLPRELVKPTFQERIMEQRDLEGLRDRESLVMLGLPPDEIERRMTERDQAEAAVFERRAREFNLGLGPSDDEDDGEVMP